MNGGGGGVGATGRDSSGAAELDVDDELACGCTEAWLVVVGVLTSGSCLTRAVAAGCSSSCGRFAGIDAIGRTASVGVAGGAGESSALIGTSEAGALRERFEPCQKDSSQNQQPA